MPFEVDPSSFSSSSITSSGRCTTPPSYDSKTSHTLDAQFDRALNTEARPACHDQEAKGDVEDISAGCQNALPSKSDLDFLHIGTQFPMSGTPHHHLRVSELYSMICHDFLESPISRSFSSQSDHVTEQSPEGLSQRPHIISQANKGAMSHITSTDDIFEYNVGSHHSDVPTNIEYSRLSVDGGVQSIPGRPEPTHVDPSLPMQRWLHDIDDAWTLHRSEKPKR